MNDEVVVAGSETKPAGTGTPVASTEGTKQTQPGAEGGAEGTDKQETQGEGEHQETPEKRESRSRRRFNRERDRRIAAETELRLLKEAQPQRQPAGDARDVQQGDEDADAPKREAFASYEDFLKAEAKFEANKTAREVVRSELEASNRKRGESEAQAEHRKTLEDWQRHTEAARDAIEDFDEVLRDGEDAPCTPAMRVALLESGESGPHIAYYLAQHPEEAERIAKLKPSRQAAEIVSLEAKVKRPAKAPSKTPAPINPVGGKAAATEPLDTRDPKAAEKLSTSEWIRRDRERMAKAGIIP